MKTQCVLSGPISPFTALGPESMRVAGSHTKPTKRNTHNNNVPNSFSSRSSNGSRGAYQNELKWAKPTDTKKIKNEFKSICPLDLTRRCRRTSKVIKCAFSLAFVERLMNLKLETVAARCGRHSHMMHGSIVDGNGTCHQLSAGWHNSFKLIASYNDR